jgi:hypothetical protein
MKRPLIAEGPLKATPGLASVYPGNSEGGVVS